MRDFAFADLLSGKRQSHCRRCQATYRRQHYLANRDEYIEREAARIEPRPHMRLLGFSSLRGLS